LIDVFKALSKLKELPSIIILRNSIYKENWIAKHNPSTSTILVWKCIKFPHSNYKTFSVFNNNSDTSFVINRSRCINVHLKDCCSRNYQLGRLYSKKGSLQVTIRGAVFYAIERKKLLTIFFFTVELLLTYGSMSSNGWVSIISLQAMCSITSLSLVI
jgi:hypothetical protein